MNDWSFYRDIAGHILIYEANGVECYWAEVPPRDVIEKAITKEALRVSKSVTAHSHGHKIYYDGYVWRYLDDDSALTDRPCVRCGRMPTPEGYDACLGHIEGATSACCGHGVHEGFVVKE